MLVQVDTSSSVRNDIAGLRAVLDRTGHPGASDGGLHRLPCLRPVRDGRLGRRRDGHRQPEGADDAAGLGFVFFNDKADAAREEADCVTHYWDWRPRVRPRSSTSISTAPRRRITSTGCAPRST
jgi:alanine-glyoxylate transaminase/serine-glyoxylate transaminase/serine-pyruvate transaminase